MDARWLIKRGVRLSRGREYLRSWIRAEIGRIFNQRRGMEASSGMMTSSLSLRPNAMTCLPENG